MNWKIAFALLAVGLLASGCAGRGGQAPTGGGAASQPSGGETGTTVGEPAAVEPSGDGIGDLFQIDTDEPLEGSGYNVPAAGEE